MIETPCVKVCALNARRGLYLGCGRNDEITCWATMNASERTRVIGELPARLVACNAAKAAAAMG